METIVEAALRDPDPAALERAVRAHPEGAFLLASRYGSPEQVATAARAGADPDETSDVGGEAYVEALYGDKYDNLAAIDAAGHWAPIHAGAALRQAVGDRDEQAVAILLELGADPNYSDPDQGFPHSSTSLCVAARHADIPLIRMLLDAGADPDIEEDHAMRPYSIAVERGRYEMAEILREYESEYLHDPDSLAERIRTFALPETMRAVLSVPEPILRLREFPGRAGADSPRWITLFSLLDAVPVRHRDRSFLRVSRQIAGRAQQLLWDPHARVLVLRDEDSDRLHPVATWPAFFADPFGTLGSAPGVTP